MEHLGMPFTVMSADIDERAIRYDDPRELTRAIARAKADALLAQIKDEALLITADTVVVCGDKIREKAATPEEAAHFLREYGFSPLQIVSAVVVTNTLTHEQREGGDVATVWFRAMPEVAITEMVSKSDICNFAGAFGFQDPLQRSFIERFDGEEESILALPKALTLRLLKELGA